MKDIKKIASTIIDKYENLVVKNDNGFGVNLDHIVGVSFGSEKKKRAEAVREIKEQLASMLKDGGLDLSENFINSLES